MLQLGFTDKFQPGIESGQHNISSFHWGQSIFNQNSKPNNALTLSFSSHLKPHPIRLAARQIYFPASQRIVISQPRHSLAENLISGTLPLGAPETPHYKMLLIMTAPGNINILDPYCSETMKMKIFYSRFSCQV